MVLIMMIIQAQMESFEYLFARPKGTTNCPIYQLDPNDQAHHSYIPRMKGKLTSPFLVR